MQIAPEYPLKNLTKIAHFVHHSRRKSNSVERGRQSGEGRGDSTVPLSGEEEGRKRKNRGAGTRTQAPKKQVPPFLLT